MKEVWIAIGIVILIATHMWSFRVGQLTILSEVTSDRAFYGQMMAEKNELNNRLAKCQKVLKSMGLGEPYCD